MKIEMLESRLTPASLRPFADYTGDYNVASYEDRTIVAPDVGGGPRVAVYVGNTLVADFFAFEESFRGGVRVAVRDNGFIVAPKAGGGPVVVYLDTRGVETGRVVRGDPSSRDGVNDIHDIEIPITPIEDSFFSDRGVVFVGEGHEDPRVRASLHDELSPIPDFVFDTVTRNGGTLRFNAGDHLTDDPLFPLELLPEARPNLSGLTELKTNTAFIAITATDGDRANVVAHEIGHLYDNSVSIETGTPARGDTDIEEYAVDFANRYGLRVTT